MPKQIIAATQSNVDMPPSGEHEQDGQTLTGRAEQATAYASLLFNTFQKFWLWLLVPIVVVLLYLSGAFENARPSTHGVVRIESPQIYTRERLVNDRFREQAWLEKQFDIIDKDTGLISGSRDTKVEVRVAGKTQKEVLASNDEPSEPNGAPRRKIDIEIDPASAFEKKRQRRASLRRALIENELDDRHDLGSNSLYQFNFGAAIIAGPRTRKVAYVGMKIKPVAALIPLSKTVKSPDHKCLNLHQFECGYLFDRGILTPESEDEMAIVKAFQHWEELFNRWIATENSNYRKESRSIQRLLQSPEAKAQLKSPMEKFFIQLDDTIKRGVFKIESVINRASQQATRSWTLAVSHQKRERLLKGVSRYLSLHPVRCP